MKQIFYYYCCCWAFFYCPFDDTNKTDICFVFTLVLLSSKNESIDNKITYELIIMIEPSRTDEFENESKISPPISSPIKPLTSTPVWLKRGRIIGALVYILLLIAYLTFIIVCIALYPRCEPAPATPWWINSVFLRFSTRSLTWNDVNEKLDQYQKNFSMQALWLHPVVPLSDQFNPLGWDRIDMNSGGEQALKDLVNKAQENNLRILIDYPLNHLSVQSPLFTSGNNESYFVWNEQGNTSNWMTVNDNRQSAWTYDSRKRSFYLHQFNNNNDSIDINYRNNRVFQDMIDSLNYWGKQFQINGFNLQGISYAYEDFEYRNETNEVNKSRTRHLDEDYLLLARIRASIDQEQILLLDSIDSLTTFNQQSLQRYYTDQNGYLTGVQLASLNNFTLINEFETNLTILFDDYYRSVFYNENHPLLWSSQSSNSRLNEVFFAACLFHIGAISIDIDHQGNLFSPIQLDRLRQIVKFAQTLDVFRAGRIEQNILPNSQLLTIERARRGSRHHMIIVNFSNTTQEDTIELKQGNINAVEILVTNSADSKYETNGLIDMKKSIRLNAYEYLIIRWSPSIEGLSIIF